MVVGFLMAALGQLVGSLSTWSASFDVTRFEVSGNSALGADEVREVLREGVRLVEEREKRLVALDAAIARGLADADAGRTYPIEEVEARLVAKYRKMAEERGL